MLAWGLSLKAKAGVRTPAFYREQVKTVKKGIHPEYVEATVKCSCGESFVTRSTRPELHVEICSQCHPFYTGKQKLVDSGGRVERFQKRFQSHLNVKESKGNKRAQPG